MEAEEQITPESVITPQPPTPVILNEAQLAHVSTLIQAAREGTAQGLKRELASAERARAAMQIELDELKQLQAPQSDAELLASQARVREMELEVSTTRADLQTAAANAALQTAVSAGGFVNNAQAALLLRDVAATSDGSAASLASLVSQFAAANPHLVRSDVKGGAGSTPAAGQPGPERINVRSIFGPGSNASLANRLAQTNMAEYKRLRVIAQQSGLIG